MPSTRQKIAAISDGIVTCVERDEHEFVDAVVIRTQAVGEVGTLYVTAEDIEVNDWKLEMMAA